MRTSANDVMLSATIVISPEVGCHRQILIVSSGYADERPSNLLHT